MQSFDLKSPCLLAMAKALHCLNSIIVPLALQAAAVMATKRTEVPAPVLAAAQCQTVCPWAPEMTCAGSADLGRSCSICKHIIDLVSKGRGAAADWKRFNVHFRILSRWLGRIRAGRRNRLIVQDLFQKPFPTA